MKNDVKLQLKYKIERWKLKAEGFLKENTRAFVVDIENTYYFCDIIFVGDTYLYVQNFREDKPVERIKLFWADVIRFDEFKEKGEEK